MMLTTKIFYPFNITFLDYPDNESHAITLYMLGCDNECKNCHNPKFKNIYDDKNFKEFTIESLYTELKKFSILNETDKIILTGGDPLSCYNISFTKDFLKNNNDFDIVIYTGKNISFVCENNINKFTFIKCGCYLEELKQESLKTDTYFQLASKNQEFYDSNLKLLSKDGIYYF